MDVSIQIEEYISSQVESKKQDLLALHGIILQLMPDAELWFLDGTDGEGKLVSNPNIGYGVQSLGYADGSSREFYRVGLSGNKSGISIYIMGIKDKTFLPKTCDHKIGKATITRYCIKFKTLRDINIEALKTVILAGLAVQVA